jgi:NitT/TauT family transport system substrate-binding protein
MRIPTGIRPFGQLFEKTQMGKCKVILLIAVLALTAVGSSAQERDLKKAKLVLQWTRQAQFAGYYIALERGIYRKHGIDLKILPAGDMHPIDLLKKKEAEFCSLWLPAGIQIRSKGEKLVNIAQIVQKTSMMLIAKKSSGIRKPEDMNGKKVGLWGPMLQIQPQAFFRKYKIKVKAVPQSYSVDLFLRDGVDVASAMWYNEYHTIVNTGLNPEELTTFPFQEYGLDFPEDGLYTLEKILERDPELCSAFVAATIEGWRYALAHPQEALDTVVEELKKAHIPLSRIHQKWMLEKLRDKIMPGNNSGLIGKLSPDDYKHVATTLKDCGLITDIPPFTEFHRNLIISDEK